MKKDNKKKHIVAQINRPVIAFMVFLIVFNTIFLFLYNMKRSVSDRFDGGNRLGQSVASELESYRCLGFLIPYWQEHYEEMEFLYDDDEKLAEKEKLLRQKLDGMTEVSYVTVEEAYALDEEGQRLLAETCYALLSRSMDRYKRAYNALYLYSFVVKGDELFILVTGVKDGELRIHSGGEVYELGSTSPYEEGWYPILDEILRTKKPAASMELSMHRGADRSAVHVFNPVYVDGEFSMIVAVSMEWKDLLSEAIRVSLLVAVVAALLFVLAAAGFIQLIRKVAVKPLQKEQAIIKAYKENKNTQEAVRALSTVTSGNEIEELAENFSSMVSELDRYMEEIRTVTAEKERIGAELSVAKQIQADMLPSIFPPFPERSEFDIYASMNPAKEVGGDFYDFFLIDDDHLALVIADVSGKGVPAALFMVVSKTLLKNQALMKKEPKDVLMTVNNQLCENNDAHMFVTVWLGIYEISTGILKAANAGHEYPAIRRADGQFELFKDKHGLVLAGMEDVKYRQYELQLNAGDTLFVYTDGVAEATNSENELFGTERMIDSLNKKPDAGPKELICNVNEGITGFVGGADQFDDITMLAVKISSIEGV